MPIHRTHDAALIRAAVEPKARENFDPVKWLDETDNVAFVQETDRSIGLFEWEYPGLYTGHYFFQPETRGKAAKALAQEMLSEIFLNYGAKVVRGLTPHTNQAARWMTRQIGFQSYGGVDTEYGPMELFIITLDRFFHTLKEKKD